MRGAEPTPTKRAGTSEFLAEIRSAAPFGKDNRMPEIICSFFFFL